MIRDDKLEFLAMLYSQPLIKANATVVLCGEDWKPRYELGLELFRANGAATVLFTGGMTDPPRKQGALALMGDAMADGLAPDRIVVDHESMNTHEQADHVIEMALVRKWTHIQLVASAYHLPRAFLTFLRSLQGCDERKSGESILDKLRIVPVADSRSRWGEAPVGYDTPRTERFWVEMQKLEEYQAKGHVARWDEAIGALLHWEKPRE